MLLRRHFLLAAALLTLVAASAQAGDRPSAAGSATALKAGARNPRRAALLAWKPRAWTPPATNSLRSNGLRVSIDPIDGTMGMPAADELAQQLVIGDDVPVQIDHAPDGTITAHLDDRWADFAVATIGPGGKPGWTCVQGRRGAAQFLKRPVVPVIPAALKWEDK
jgi:hypothetical protein